MNFGTNFTHKRKIQVYYLVNYYDSDSYIIPKPECVGHFGVIPSLFTLSDLGGLDAIIFPDMYLEPK